MKSYCIALSLIVIISRAFSMAPDGTPAPPFSSYVITNFTADNGLPQNTVDLVNQTSDGYIWIGTYAGLARYDGNKFIHFNKSLTPAFKINHVTSLIEDKNGIVWIGTNGGGVLKYAQHAFSAVQNNDGFGNEFIKAFLYDGNNYILAGTERRGIQKLSLDDNGTILSISPYASADLPQSFLLRTIARDKLNRILIATDIGLIIVDNDKSRTLTTDNGLPNNSISALAIDQNGVIWIGTSNGLARLQDDKIQVYTTVNGLTNNAIRTLFVDRSNVLWIGTDGGGINRCFESNGTRMFDALTVDEGLVNNFVRTIFQDSENNIWIGTRNGLSQIHIRKFELFGKKAGLSDSYVRTVFEDSHNRLWIGTNGNGLNRMDSDGIKIWSNDKELPNKFIRALYEDKNGILWIGTDGGGVLKFDERKKPGSQFTRITTENGLTENYIRAILEGFDNEIWVATYGGGISRIKGDSILPLTVKQGLANDNVLA
ncbi:MAG: two-component regulator propeller domain-containing protein, partial [Bacteroidota bacterium]